MKSTFLLIIKMKRATIFTAKDNENPKGDSVLQISPPSLRSMKGKSPKADQIQTEDFLLSNSICAFCRRTGGKFKQTINGANARKGMIIIMKTVKELILPGNYGKDPVDADSRRCEFDIKNEQIFYGNVPVDLLFAGDSITHFMEEGKLYHKYGFVVNRGIGGDMAHIMAWRFTADVTQLRPRLAIVLVGVNNTWELDSTIGEDGYFDSEASEKVRAVIIDSYRKMLEEARDYGFTMWVASLLPTSEKMPNYKARNKFIKDTNTSLSALAEQYGTEYVDYYSAMVIPGTTEMKEGVSREGIHPNGKGYELMSQVLIPMLDRFFGIAE